jgi:hypothetical protein
MSFDFTLRSRSDGIPAQLDRVHSLIQYHLHRLVTRKYTISGRAFGKSNRRGFAEANARYPRLIIILPPFPPTDNVALRQINPLLREYKSVLMAG